MKRRVVVTGLGAVTPIGNTVDEFSDRVSTGKTEIVQLPDLMRKDIKHSLQQK